MRAIISRAKRCLSLLLAVLLVVPAMSLPAFAAEHDHAEGMLLSQVIVANYENLPAAEKTIINSGVLKGDQAVAEHYPALPDDLVALGDGKTVIASASSANGYTWKPGNTALLYVDGALQEQITLTNGVGTYKYNGSAFEIQVTYELHKELTAGEMEASLALLNVAYNLNQDIVKFKTLTAKNITMGGSSMSVVDVLGAMTNPSYGMLLGVDGTIVDLIGTMAEGIKYEADGTFIKNDINIGLVDAAKTAAEALSSEQAAGGLLLARFFAEHSGMSALEMIAEHGEDLNAAIASNYDTLVALNDEFSGLPEVEYQLRRLVKNTLPSAMSSLYSDLNDQLADFKAAITDENLAAQLPETIEDVEDVQKLVEVLEAQRNSLLNMVNNKLENTEYTGGAITGSDDVGDVADWLEEGTNDALAGYGYDSIEDALADLNGKIAEGEAALEEVYAERDGLLGEYGYTSIDEALADLDEKIAEAEGQLDDLNAAIEQMEAAIEQADTAIGQLEDGIDELEATIAQLEAAIAMGQTQLEAQLTQAQDALTQAQAALTQAQAQRAELQTGLTQAQAAVTACEQAIAQATDLKGQLNEAKDGLAEAEAALEEVKRIKRELESLKSLVQYVQDAQDGLADLEAAIENLDALQEGIVEAEATMATLDTYLSGVTTLISVVNKLIEGLEPAYNYRDSWTVNDQIDLSALTGAAKSTQYSILTEAASRSGVTYEKYDLSDVKDSVYLLDGVTGCTRSMSVVTVTVKLEVINAANATVTSTYTGKVSLTDGTGAAGIKSAIAAIEAEALAQWSDYDEDHYRVTSDELDVPAVLDGPVSFEITYSPKTYKVTFEGDLETYEYGWNITLPKHDDPEKAYDYDVNGDKYMQGATITVVGTTDITRTEGDAYVRETLLNAMTAELANSNLAAVLNSGGVHGVYEEYIYVRYPKETVSYNAGTHVVTAENYASDYKNAQWVPVSANLCTEDHAVVNTVKFNGGNTVEVTYNGDFDYIDVAYELDLGFDADEVMETLNGVAEIYNDAVVQLTGMDTMVEQLKDKITLMDIAIGAVEGSDNPDTQAALAELNAKCKPAGGGDYYIITHLNNYSGNTEPYGLEYFYRNAEGETGIIASLANMIAPLKVIIKDDVIDGLVETAGGGFDPEAILKSIEELSNDLKEAAPSKTIKDPRAVAYALGNPKTMPDPALQPATLTADGKLTLSTNVSAPVDVTMKSVNIAVTILDAYDAGVPVNTTAVYVAEGYPLSDDQIEALVAAAAELSPQGDDLEIYAANIDDLAAYLEDLIITANTTVSYKWSLTCTHDAWDAATCVTPATCKRCGLTYGGVDADAHSWGGWTVTEAATCTEDGSKTRSCSLCGETDDAVITAPGHTWGAYSSNNDATCEEDGTKSRSCLVCGGLDTTDDVGSALGHSYGDWIDSGSDELHIRYCDNLDCTKFETGEHGWDSGVVTVESTCTKHGVITYTCADCGATKTENAPLAAHTYKWTVTADETGHIMTCTDCGATSGAVKNHVWNTNDCETAGYCTDCGKIKAKGEHYFEWSFTEHEHTQTCTTESCGKTVTAAHNWVPGDVHEPTCVEEGHTDYSCLCGATKEEPIPATGEHTLGKWTQTVPPTCTEPGEERRDCDLCDYFETRPIEATGHSWDEGVVTTPATCTEPGEMTYTCTVPNCGETRTEPIDSAGAHSWGDWTQTVPPTCTEPGEERRDCDQCDYFETRPVEATGHTLGDWAQTDAPSCTEEGEERRDCDQCDYFETQPVAATGHSFADGWTADVTGHWHVCQNGDCQEISGFAGHVYPDGTPCDAVGVACTVCGRPTGEGEGSHSMGAWTQTAPPSCTEPGEERRDCSNCEHFETRPIAATGHSWDEGVETAAPGCESEGEMTYTCTAADCDETRTEPIPATGHTEQPVPGYPATCTQPGLTDGTICSVCQKTLVEQEEIPAAGHAWDEGVVTVPATKFTAGEMTYTCTVSDCGETRTEVIPALSVEDEIVINVNPVNKEIVLPGDDGSLQYDINYTITLSYNGKVVTIEKPVASAEGATVKLRDYVTMWVSNGTFANANQANVFIRDLRAEHVTVEAELVDAYANKLETFVSKLNGAAGALDFSLIQNADGSQAIVANVTNAKGLTGVLMDLVSALGVYGYIGMEDSDGLYQPFYYNVKLSLQALIDGLLAEDGFGTDRILEIVDANGNIIPTTDLVADDATVKGSGKIGGLLQTVNVALGDSPEATPEHTLPLHLTVTDPTLITSDIRGMLASIKPYLSINTLDGKLNADLTLPEKIYEGYLAVGLLTGVEDKSDAGSVLSEEAFNYIYDYIVDATEGVTVDTYENTAGKLGYALDLTGTYESIANYLISVLSEGVAVTEDDRVFLTQYVSKSCKTILDQLLNTAGFALPEQVLDMIIEYQNGDDLSVDLQAQLTSDEVDFEVAVIDVQNGSNLDKVDFAEVGAARINAMQGTGAVMLLADIEGNLVFNNTTILDLNGKTITGSIKANAPLVIIDSCMDTYLCGGVDGKIEGNVTIIAGNYTADVTKFLAEGYVQKDGTVRNALYHVVKTSTFARAANETVTYVINSDFIDEIDGYLPSVRELAVDIAADLVLNYITAASFSVDGETITAIDLTDVIDLISGGDRVEKIVDELLGCVDVDGGVTYFINALFADLLNFEGIAYAIENDTAIATHTVTTRPWLVTVERIANGDYITASLTYNTDDSVKKEFDLSLVIDGQNAKTAALPLFKELAEIVDANETKVEVALDQPIYDDQIVTVVGTLTANAVADLTLGGSDSDDYATVLGVILAYGNTAKRAAVADAINNADLAALKAVVDGTSVKELFTALKAMSRDVTFAEMATAVGVTVNVGIGEYLDTLYRYVFVGAGKVLEKLEITGMDSKLGGLYNAQTGFYELSKGAARDGNYTHSSGYGVDYDLTLDESGLKVKLFPEISAADTTWTVTVYGNKGTHFTSSKGDWDYGDNEIVITLDADEELTFEYWVDDNRTLTSFKINGENVRSKYPANKEHTISVADFGSEVEIYIASTPTIVPSTKVICDCGDPDCTCKIECHSTLYEDLAAILAANPNVWWHLDGHRYLDYVICKGLMVGTSTDPLLFEPSMLMSRSMIVTALYHLEGDPEVTGNPSDYYTDVLDGWWYSDAIVWATNEGLVYGYGNDKFGADDVLTREQLATLFYRFTEYKGKDVDYNGSLDLSGSFTDAGDISTWALTGMEWAYDRGLISGPGNNILLPKGDISRCEFAALLCHWIWGEYDD